MKKLLITFLVLIIFTNYSYANECLIQDSSSKVLLDYIKNNRIIIKNVTREIVEQSSANNNTGVKKNIENIKNSSNEIISIFNTTFSIKGYLSYADFYILYPLFNEVPYQAKRDNTILQNENEGMAQYISKIAQKGNINKIIKEPCKGTDNNIKCREVLNPDGNGSTAKKIVGKLIENNEYILDLYRLTTMGKRSNFEDKEKLFLVQNNFENEIERNYGKKALSVCSKKDGFFKTISDKIAEIELLNKQSTDGITEWQNAWKLLTGAKGTEKEAKEISENALKNYKGNTGVKDANYKENKINKENNFIINSYNISKDNIAKSMEEWDNAVRGDFFKEKADNKTNLVELRTITQNSELSKRIKERIEILYQYELPFTQISGASSQKIENQIKELHTNLSKGINTLEETITIAQKVCKEQASDRGKCD